MTVAAIIVQGIGPGGSVPYLLTGGYGAFSAAPVVAVEDTGRLRRGGPAPFSYTRYYAPPHTIVKKKRAAIRELKELYIEARKEIPPALQIGLLPLGLIFNHRATATLPVPARVDFEKFAENIHAIRTLIAAYEAEMTRRDEAEKKRLKRRKDEEALLIFLMDIL